MAIKVRTGIRKLNSVHRRREGPMLGSGQSNLCKGPCLRRVCRWGTRNSLIEMQTKVRQAALKWRSNRKQLIVIRWLNGFDNLLYRWRSPPERHTKVSPGYACAIAVERRRGVDACCGRWLWYCVAGWVQIECPGP